MVNPVRNQTSEASTVTQTYRISNGVNTIGNYMSKILFVYPNSEGYPMIPLSISILAGILKKNNHLVDLFDATFMTSQLDHMAREKTGTVKKVNFEKYWGKAENKNIYEELKKKINDFKPDLVAFTIVENNYFCAKKCFGAVKSVTIAPLIVGGVFPTAAPHFFEADENVDIICIGEGEHALLELANRIGARKDYADIPNLYVKKEGKIIKNNFEEYYNWEPPTLQEWKIFDERHIWKAFVGKIWKTGFFEMSRGCPYNCYYCNNHISQKIFSCLGKYHREKPMEYVIDEIEQMKKEFSLELIFFNDENFLMMSEKRYDEFCEKFKERINLPFYFNTRAETLLNEVVVNKLKETNCVGIGIGIETGNEKTRKELLNKNTPNEIYEKAISNTNKYGIRTTGYIMLGLPFETEESIIESAEFCKKLNITSVGLAIFAPYYGTRLHEICVKNNFMENRLYDNISVNYHSILKQPQLPEQRLEELYYNFNKMVYGDSQGR